MWVNGPFSMLATFTINTGYFQDRLLPEVTFVHDVRTTSGAALVSLTYRYSEVFSATDRRERFLREPPEDAAPDPAAGASEQRGRLHDAGQVRRPDLDCGAQRALVCAALHVLVPIPPHMCSLARGQAAIRRRRLCAPDLRHSIREVHVPILSSGATTGTTHSPACNSTGEPCSSAATAAVTGMGARISFRGLIRL